LRPISFGERRADDEELNLSVIESIAAEEAKATNSTPAKPAAS